MKEEIRKEARNYAWNYFQFHAEQRLKTFHFYIIIAAILTGGYITLLTDNNFPYKSWSSVLAFLLSFISFVFWRIERRNHQLVKNAEKALRHLDESWELTSDDKVLEIFKCDEEAMNNKKLFPWIGGKLRYSRCFNLVFLAFGTLGLVSGITIICIYIT